MDFNIEQPAQKREKQEISDVSSKDVLTTKLVLNRDVWRGVAKYLDENSIRNALQVCKGWNKVTLLFFDNQPRSA
jgi:hypothetical protein